MSLSSSGWVDKREEVATNHTPSIPTRPVRLLVPIAPGGYLWKVWNVPLGVDTEEMKAVTGIDRHNPIEELRMEEHRQPHKTDCDNRNAP